MQTKITKTTKLQLYSGKSRNWDQRG